MQRARATSGQPLWAALRDAELVTEEQIFAVLDGSEGFAPVSAERLAQVAPPAPLVAALPGARAVAGGIVPLDLSPDGGQARVAMIDPSDGETLAAFRAAAAVESVRALLAPPRALREALRRIYGAAASVELDPALAAEMAELPPDALTATPPPPRRAPDAGERADEDTPRVSTDDDERAGAERLTRALIEVIEALAVELEARLGARPRASELARLARRVALQLGCAPLAVDEIGVVALLHGVHTALQLADGRARADAAVEIVESLGWAAAGEGGIAHALRVLTAAASPFGRAGAGAAPLGARVVTACADYLELHAEATRAADAAPDRDTVAQLLRAGTAAGPVVDALLRVLEKRDPPRPVGAAKE